MSKKEEEKKEGAGRPSKYKEEHLEIVTMLCLLGATDKEIAEALGICEKTLNNWKEWYPKFLQSIKEGKALADAKAAKSLYKRATGFKVKEVRTIKDSQGNTKEIIETEKEVIPETAACWIWLKNRRPQDWKEKREEDSSAPTVDYEERKQVLEEMIAKAKANKEKRDNERRNS